jgi:nucleoside-diphosphate-sugar epimerase
MSEKNDVIYQEWPNEKDVAVAAGASVLVTGVTGLVGGGLARALLEIDDRFNLGMTVYGLARGGEKIRRMFGRTALRPLIADVAAPFPPDWPRFDIVIHAASPVGPAMFAADPAGVVRANLIGTLNLLDKAARDKARRFLFASTYEVYGQGKEVWKEEDSGTLDFLDPRACYPEAKRAGENACVCYGKQYGLHTGIARLSRLYGPGMNLNSGLFVGDFIKDVLAKRQVVIAGDGGLARPLLHSDDAVAGILRILFLGQADTAYNVSPDETWTLGEIAAELGRLGGCGHCGNEGTAMAKGPRQDNARLKELGWRQKISLKDGMELAVSDIIRTNTCS